MTSNSVAPLVGVAGIVAIIVLLTGLQLRRRGRRRSELGRWAKAMGILTNWQPATAAGPAPTCFVVRTPDGHDPETTSPVHLLSSARGDA